MNKTEVYLRFGGLLLSIIGVFCIRYEKSIGLTIAIFGFLIWVFGFIMRARRIKQEQP